MRAISPVIATVIIVSIAIALAIAVALWMAGITTTVSQFERLDITAAYVNRTVTVGTNTYYEIVLKVVNKGSSATTIDMIFINNKPIDLSTGSVDTQLQNGVTEASNTTNANLNPGQETTIYVYLLKANNAYSPGQIVQITVHTASGGQYPKAISLP